VSVATKQGAWISATQVTRLECSQCGLVSVSKWPMNDRQLDEAIAEHARKHGGIDRGY
jgi:hypothetical protein